MRVLAVSDERRPLEYKIFGKKWLSQLETVLRMAICTQPKTAYGKILIVSACLSFTSKNCKPMQRNAARNALHSAAKHQSFLPIFSCYEVELFWEECAMLLSCSVWSTVCYKPVYMRKDEHAILHAVCDEVAFVGGWNVNLKAEASPRPWQHMLWLTFSMLGL